MGKFYSKSSERDLFSKGKNLYKIKIFIRALYLSFIKQKTRKILNYRSTTTK